MINDERDGLVNQKYRRTLQAFNVSVSSTTDSSEDGKRRARAKMRGSDTTGIAALTKFLLQKFKIFVKGLICSVKYLAHLIIFHCLRHENFFMKWSLGYEWANA